MNKLRIGFLMGGTFIALLFASSAALPTAHASITNSLGIGSRGSDVTQLQQFLATNPQIYPSGMVTGYFGSLTAAAVTQLQVAYGIDQVGRVGPVTKAKINSIMASGFGLDTTAPYMNNLNVSQISSTSAVVGWTTDTLARGQVFFSTAGIQADEATGPFQLPSIGGNGANTNNDMNATIAHSVQLTGLQPHTVYFYIARSIDQSGNVTMSTQHSFQTN